ncbi:hypothetical protein CG482_016520 [Bacillus cytotoxicus]|nr:hypothetical protein CG482_016520 [Bacillus cytotoxicus]
MDTFIDSLLKTIKTKSLSGKQLYMKSRKKSQWRKFHWWKSHWWKSHQWKTHRWKNPKLLNTKEPNTKELNTDVNKYIVEIVTYLNDVCSSSYRSTTKKTQSLIKARLSEKFTVDDFKKVIDVKHAEWTGTPQAKYLRPETLFGTKFESYLQQWSCGRMEKLGDIMSVLWKERRSCTRRSWKRNQTSDNRGFAKTIG